MEPTSKKAPAGRVLGNCAASSCVTARSSLFALVLMLFAAFAPEARAADSEELPLLTPAVSFSELPGDAATLKITTTGEHVRVLRAFLVIDDRLAVIPGIERSSGSFEVRFPTPHRALEFRIQMILDDGTARFSGAFTATPHCARTASHSEHVNLHDVRILQAEKLREEVQLLEVLSDWVDHLPAPPEERVAESTTEGP